jgi:hypothetical protein
MLSQRTRCSLRYRLLQWCGGCGNCLHKSEGDCGHVSGFQSGVHRTHARSVLFQLTFIRMFSMATKFDAAGDVMCSIAMAHPHAPVRSTGD